MSECIQEYEMIETTNSRGHPIKYEMRMTKVCGCIECWPESQNVEESEEE